MEKTTMKLTLKIALMISLFCTTAFAGEMGNGGFADGNTDNVCGDMGNGGKCLVSDTTDVNDKDVKDDDILDFVRNFLSKILG